MKRNLILGGLALAGVLAWTESGSAQIVIRRPFGRIFIGGGAGLQVQGPNGRIIRFQPGMIGLPRQIAPGPAKPPTEPQTEEQEETPPPPRLISEKKAPPPPKPTAESPLSFKDFVEKFQPRKGTYNLTVISPATKQPTPVRFTLPEGTPARVQRLADGVEYSYGPRRFVRIQFDDDGAFVTSR